MVELFDLLNCQIPTRDIFKHVLSDYLATYSKTASPLSYAEGAKILKVTENECKHIFKRYLLDRINGKILTQHQTVGKSLNSPNTEPTSRDSVISNSSKDSGHESLNSASPSASTPASPSNSVSDLRVSNLSSKSQKTLEPKKFIHFSQNHYDKNVTIRLENFISRISNSEITFEKFVFIKCLFKVDNEYESWEQLSRRCNSDQQQKLQMENVTSQETTGNMRFEHVILNLMEI